MEMKANRSQILMSDVLRQQLPDHHEEMHPVDQMHALKHVIVVAEKITLGKTDGLIGVLRGIVLGSDPEIEFRCALDEGLQILSAQGLSFGRFELHHGEDVIIPIPGPFLVKAARIDEISPVEQLCTLGLHLTRSSRQ